MIIRRIRRSEQDDLSDFCLLDRRWYKYYINHEKWLTKALEDIAGENRVVFGAFVAKPTEGDKFENQLVSCMFLKLSPFENSIEFKNLIIPVDSIELDGETSALVKKMIYKAVLFCEVRGITKIEIELPQEEHGIIAAFLAMGFRVVALRDRFNLGNLLCILERSIGDKYYGDPFDSRKFAGWLLNSFISCKIISTRVDPEDDIYKISFEGRTSSKAFSDSNPIGKRKRLRGEMWVMEDSESIDEEIENCTGFFKKYQGLIILVSLSQALSEDSKKLLNEHRVIYFDKGESRDIAGGSDSSLAIPIESYDVNGVITVLEYEQIIEYAKRESLTYYLLSGIHNGLILPSDGDPLVLTIYCSEWEKKGPGIVGFCIINGIRNPRFTDMLSEELPDDSALSKEDLSFYKTYSENERIAELKCSKIYLLENPLKIKNGGWVNNDRMRNYLYKELIDNGNNSAYLDQDTSSKLRDHFIENGYQFKSEKSLDMNSKRKINRFKVGLSFAGEDREYVGKVAEKLILELGKDTVFYDKYYEAELNGKDLDLRLGHIYRNECDLVAVFTSENYNQKNWCGLEWGNIRNMLFKIKDPHRVMMFKIDKVEIEGWPDIYGFSDIGSREPDEIVDLILKKLKLINSLT